jgi:adenosine/AMP kinase
MELKTIRLEVPDGGNIIAGQTHFIKTVEDLYEAVVNTVPQAKFGIAFNEASGACLTRVEGNDDGLKALAARNATAIGAGHIFVIALGGGAYPINLMNRIKDVPEVCAIFCATANPVEVIVAETEQGRGVLGVVDGVPPKGVEQEQDARWRHDFLRKIGYKL